VARAGPYIGREAAIRQFEQNRETFDNDRLEPVTDFIGIGERVVVRTIWCGEGQGPESALEWTVTLTVRKGNIVNIDYFWDHAEALAAVGLSE
jgi:hypothetical protein